MAYIGLLIKPGVRLKGKAVLVQGVQSLVFDGLESRR